MYISSKLGQARSTVTPSVLSPAQVLSPPPLNGRTCGQNVVFSPESTLGLPFFLTKSPLPICYPRGQLFTQHQSLSPGGQRKKSISPRGDNIGKSAVCHPVPLRLVYATSNATGAWDIHSSRPTVSCQRGLLLLLTIAATRRRRVQTSPRVVRLVFPTCFS